MNTLGWCLVLAMILIELSGYNHKKPPRCDARRRGGVYWRDPLYHLGDHSSLFYTLFFLFAKLPIPG
jgi:hypothetical protein